MSASVNLPPPSSGPGQSPVDDIIKMGVLRKGKKGKKRFFVLRQDSYTAPASMYCYESEKKFRQQLSNPNVNSSKLTIKLKDVFNLNKTVDGKMKNCVGVFARDESLKLGCDNEQDQEAWLQTLFNVYMNTKSGTPEENMRQNFDFCWDVIIVKDKGLTEKSPCLGGAHRFCLNSCSIYLYKKTTDDPCVEFPLVYISNYGHKNDTLYLRVGRSAVTGPGELWMQTDDAVVAQNIHETMKTILEENHDLRQRSASTGEPRRQSNASSWSSSRTNSMISCDRSTPLLSVLGPQSRTRAISESEKTLSSRFSANVSSSLSNSAKRKISAPVPMSSAAAFRRCRTESETSYEESSTTSSSSNVRCPSSARKLTSPNLVERRKASSISLRGHLSHLQHRSYGVSSETLQSFSGAVAAGSSGSSGGPPPLICPLPSPSTLGSASNSARSASHSPSAFHPALQQWAPPGQSPLTASPANLSSTDSVASASTAGDHENPTIGVRFAHWPMSERAVSLEYVASQPTIVEEGSGSGAEYLPMQPPTTTTPRNIALAPTRYRGLLSEPIDSNDSYVDMNSTADKERRRMTGDSGYMEMASPMKAASSMPSKKNSAGDLPSSSSSDQVTGDTGYTPMGPSSLGRWSGANSRQTSWHLEEVRSYISDSDSTCSSNVQPCRAYSLGSKPTAAMACGSSVVKPVAPSTSSVGPPSYLNKMVLSLSDDRKRAHSVGNWKRQEMLKGSAGLLVPQQEDKNDYVRQRSESFGSGRSTPAGRRFTDSSKRSNFSEDLVEMDFGPSSVGRSPSGSIGSSESLNRSRTGSMGAKNFWSPKVEQINEQELIGLQYQSPSTKFIQQRFNSTNYGDYVQSGDSSDYASMTSSVAAPSVLTDYVTMGATSAGSTDPTYSMMGGGNGASSSSNSLKISPLASTSYITTDGGCVGAKSDYVVMNSRHKTTTTRKLDSARVGGAAPLDPESSSGYSSTGDCSTSADVTIPQNSSPRITIGGEVPNRFFQDVCRHDDDELLRRLARVEMGTPNHSPPAAETYVNLNIGAHVDEHSSATVYENMNICGAVAAATESTPSSRRSPTKAATINLTVQNSLSPSAPVKRSRSLNQRGDASPSTHPRKLSENPPQAAAAASSLTVNVVPSPSPPASAKSPKSPRSPIMNIFSSFGKGQAKLAKPAAPVSSKDDSTIVAASAASSSSLLPQQRPVCPPTASTGAARNMEYASLDLNSTHPTGTPVSRTTSPKSSTTGGTAAPTGTGEDAEASVVYAQIDVAKSEGLRKSVRQC